MNDRTLSHHKASVSVEQPQLPETPERRITLEIQAAQSRPFNWHTILNTDPGI